MRIFVVTRTGTRMPINVNENDTILQIKQKIQNKESIILEKQHLTFSGIYLENSRKIIEYTIKENSSLDLIVPYKHTKLP